MNDRENRKKSADPDWVAEIAFRMGKGNEPREYCLYDEDTAEECECFCF